VQVLSCEEIAREIKENLDFLTTPLRDIPKRHRSLRAVFDHSWDLLMDEEKGVLRRISVFQGGFSREAAAQAAGAKISHLSTLLGKSLLRKSSPTRYELHEILHQYASEKLREESREDEQTRGLHCLYYANFLESIEAHLKNERQSQSLQSIGEDVENIRHAWQWALDRGEIHLIEKFVEGLYNFFVIRGFMEDGKQAFLNAVHRLKELQADENSDPTLSKLIARMCSRSGVFYAHLSDFDKARELYEECLAISRPRGDEEEIAFTLHQLSILLEEKGEYDAARAAGQESLDTYEKLGDMRGKGHALNQLGAIAYQQGDYKLAVQLHQKSLAFFRELNDRWGLASTLINLGNVESELSEYTQAEAFYRESMAICEEIGAQSGLATTLNNLGDIERELGEFEQAKDYLKRSLQIYIQIGDQYGQSIVLSNLGGVAYRLGQYGEAKKLLEESKKIGDQVGVRLQSAYALTQLGNVALAMTNYQEAEGYYHESLRIAMNNACMPLALETLVGIAHLEKDRGEKEKSLDILTFVLTHPAIMKESRDEAEYLQAGLSEEFTNEYLEQVKRSACNKTIKEVVNGVLGEKCQSTP
jgi:tetratricopeptide (TPR) repeat protein